MARDPFELTGADVTWIVAPVARTPDEHIDGLLRRRFKRSWRARFRSRAAKAIACEEFTRRLQEEFDDGVRDALATRVFGRPDPRDAIRSFQNFCVGFTPTQLRRERVLVARRRDSLLQLARKHAKRHAAFAKQAKRENDATRRFLHELYRSRLSKEENWISKYFGDPVARAADALRQRANRRRFGSWFGALTILDTYTQRASWFEYSIESLHPDALSFPFRFYRRLPLKTLRALRAQWRAGRSAAQLLPTLEKHVDWTKLFDGLVQDVHQLGSVLPRVRASAMAELRSAWEADAFLSVATVAATQVEGLLWDVAAHLNRAGKRIFKQRAGRRFPYAWDFRTQEYVQKTKRGTPIAKSGRNEALLSARSLLRHTRLGEFFRLDVHSFLMDEHYTDRCHYAHGGGTSRDVRADAVMALLCLSAVVVRVLEIVEGPPDPV